MKTVQDIFDEINEQQLSITKMMLKDRATVRTSKMPDTNCPNCGAPRQGRSCEYCGTVFISYCNAKPQRQIEYDAMQSDLEAQLEAQQKLLRMLATIKNAEQQRQMIQNIVPYGFNPMTNASQCCCSIRDSMQQQHDLQQCSALDDTLARNRILTPNETRGIIGFKPFNIFY